MVPADYRRHPLPAMLRDELRRLSATAPLRVQFLTT